MILFSEVRKNCVEGILTSLYRHVFDRSAEDAHPSMAPGPTSIFMEVCVALL